MNPYTKHNSPFALDPTLYGLPDREELVSYRIWDTHYHGFWNYTDPIKQHQEMMLYIQRMGIERVLAIDLGGTLQKPLIVTPFNESIKKLLITEQDHLSGIITIDPGYPEESCEKMKEWIANGPCVGIKYVGGNQLGLTCDHPNSNPIIEYAAELGAVIYIHTWIKTGGDPRYPGGANLKGESTPMNVATLAKRFPDVSFICGHAGGDWELGIRAVRSSENVWLEFSGADPQSGSVDLAVKELGVDRIVWGGHGPSRSYATELAKVLDASLSHDERMKIFGRNYRHLAEPIFRKKGLPITV